MEKVRGVESLPFTGRPLVVQQNADTSLSCHHNNTNSKTGNSNSEHAPDVGVFEMDKQSGPTIETRLACQANLDIGHEQRHP
jgi:hypothetical protein